MKKIFTHSIQPLNQSTPKKEEFRPLIAYSLYRQEKNGEILYVAAVLKVLEKGFEVVEKSSPLYLFEAKTWLLRRIYLGIDALTKEPPREFP